MKKGEPLLNREGIEICNLTVEKNRCESLLFNRNKCYI